MECITDYGNETRRRYKRPLDFRDKRSLDLSCVLLSITFLFAFAVLITFLFAVFSPVTEAAVPVKDAITTDVLWSAELSPYLVEGNISVAKNATLKIEPGVTVTFKGTSDSSDGYYLEVDGVLDAQGDANHPILFTTESKGQYWGYIEFTKDSAAWDEEGSSGCILSRCIVEYAGNGQGDAYGNAAIRSISASPLIKDSIIRYSKADGIIAHSGTQAIINNQIHDTACGITLISSEGGLIENNYLIRNNQGIYLESGTGMVTVRNNTVRSSSSKIYGGCLGVRLLYHDNLSTYFWEQISGPEIELTDPNNVKATFTVPDTSAHESLTFQLTVIDREGLFSVDTTTVDIGWENKPPVADAGPDQTAVEGNQIELSGLNSIDPDGSVLSYAWEQTSGPAVTLSNISSAHCTFTAPSGAGKYGTIYIFQLTITDSDGLQSRDTVNIHVTEKNGSNKVPIAKAGPCQNVTEGSTVTLDGSGSSNPENHIISWMWEQADGPHVDLIDAISQRASFIAPPVGKEGKALTFQLTITDDAFQRFSDTVIVNIIDANSGANEPPEADAGEPENADEGTTVALNGSAIDTDGVSDIDTYDWKQVSGTLVNLTGTGASRSFKAPNLTHDEELAFRLTVTDEYGLKSTDTVKIMVKWINEGPTAHCGSDQTIKEGMKVLLDGSGSSDPDDGIASYLWTQLVGTPVTLSGNTVVKPVLTAPSVTSNEQLIFQLAVTDQSGVSSRDVVYINVTPENKPPAAHAGPDLAVGWGAAVTLDGSESNDPENHIISWLWEQTGGPKVTLYDATTAQPRFTAPQKEKASSFQPLTFRLTVENEGRVKSSDSVVVNVIDDEIIGNNQMPIAEAGPDQTATAGATVTLDGSKSIDPNAVCELQISYNHFINDDSEGVGNAIAIEEGPYDNCKLSIISNNLENLKGKFLVYLHDWADKDAGPVNMAENWWGVASSSDIDRMIYDHNCDLQVPQVNYNLAEDAQIAGAGSNLSYPPMANAGEDNTVNPDDTVTLDGSGTYDPDKTMKYTWEQIEGQTITLHNVEDAVATCIAPSPQEDNEDDIVKFKLTVVDGKGCYDTDEVAITIKPSKKAASRKIDSGCFISTIVPKVW